jgi:hypothetical protein
MCVKCSRSRQGLRARPPSTGHGPKWTAAPRGGPAASVDPRGIANISRRMVSAVRWASGTSGPYLSIYRRGGYWRRVALRRLRKLCSHGGRCVDARCSVAGAETCPIAVANRLSRDHSGPVARGVREETMERR